MIIVAGTRIIYIRIGILQQRCRRHTTRSGRTRHNCPAVPIECGRTRIPRRHIVIRSLNYLRIVYIIIVLHLFTQYKYYMKLL